MNRHKTHEEKQALVKQVEQLVAEGQTKKQACKSLGMRAWNYSQWKEQTEGIQSPARQIKTRNVDNERQLRIENTRLKMIVADQALDIQALKEWRSR